MSKAKQGQERLWGGCSVTCMVTQGELREASSQAASLEAMFKKKEDSMFAWQRG